MKNIDIQITNQLNLLEKLSESFQFTEICEFSIEKSNEIVPYDKLHISGLYFIEIKNQKEEDFAVWIENFKPKFRGLEKEFLHKFTPNIIEKRIKKLKKTEDAKPIWIPFYIGKSKKISQRVHSHINSTLGRPPFALKLNGRKNLNDEVFRLKILEIKDVINYDVIVPKLETIFREKLNPLVGKQ